MQDCCSYCGLSFYGFVCFGILCVDYCYFIFIFYQGEMIFNYNEWYLLCDLCDIIVMLGYSYLSENYLKLLKVV